MFIVIANGVSESVKRNNLIESTQSLVICDIAGREKIERILNTLPQTAQESDATCQRN